MGVSLVSLNIERAKHYDRILPFLKETSPDVVCVQELYERDVEMLGKELGYTGIFEPLGLHPLDAPEEGVAMQGIGIFSRLPIIAHEVRYYSGDENSAHSDDPDRKTANRAALFATIVKDGDSYEIGTTHFTWTPDGGANDQQRADLARMMRILDAKRSFVLCGDFNAPRGGEIFSAIAAVYTDNVPPQYVWSLDMKYHRAANGILQAAAEAQNMQGFMVDGMFSTPEYALSDTRLQDGLSDHLAILTTVRKA